MRTESQYDLRVAEMQGFPENRKDTEVTLEPVSEIELKTLRLVKLIREKLSLLGLLDVHGVEKKLLALAQENNSNAQVAREIVRLVWYVVRLNLPLIRLLANKYGFLLESSSADLDDALQEACFAAFRATLKYDPARGKFSNCLELWVKQLFINKRTYEELSLKVPRHIVNLLKKKENRLDGLNDLKEHELRALLALTGQEIRLNANYVENGESDLAGVFPKSNNPSPEEEFSRIEAMELVRKLIDEFLLQLKEREREVVCLRFGLNGEKPHTLQEIATRFGVTKERIRQIEKKAIGKLKSRFFRKVGSDWEVKQVVYDLLMGNL